MQNLIVAATEAELQPFKAFDHQSDVLITGVGTAATVYQLARKLAEKPYRLVIQAGIAGSFDISASLGETVVVKSDLFAGSGFHEKGKFTPLFNTPLLDAAGFPFENGRLVNSHPSLPKLPFRAVDALSVDMITDDIIAIEQIKTLFAADIESMEGAAFHYVCLMEHISFIQLRGISNYVGDRNKSNWKMEEAINNLNAALELLLSQADNY